jgi:hypothetical protein
MPYMPIINGCQAQEAFALPGLISLTFPALRPKPWDLLEIQQQQLNLTQVYSLASYTIAYY